MYGSLLLLQLVSEQLILFHKRRDIHMNDSAAMLNQIIPSDYIFRIIMRYLQVKAVTFEEITNIAGLTATFNLLVVLLSCGLLDKYFKPERLFSRTRCDCSHDFPRLYLTHITVQ